MRISWRPSGSTVAALGLTCALAASSAARGEEAADRAPEQLPPGAQVVRLEALPTSITLATPYEYAQLLLTAELATGERVDVTRLAQFAEPPTLLKLSANGQVRPTGDGQTELNVTFAGQSLAIPVTITGQSAPYAVSYVRDVAPALSRLGCNAGTCHGSANGKNGFKLSLRGYDALYDHRALTDDLAGRRFNRAAPDQSLMLLKPAGGVPHTGGVPMHAGEPSYELLKAWISQGVALDLDSPRVTGIELFPKNPTIPLPGMRQQIRVLATYANGAIRDVTAEAFLESSLPEKLEVDRQGIATAVRRGEAAILARYEGSYTATPVVIMGDRSGYQWQDAPENNHIDSLVYAKLRKVKLLPSGLCSDSDFLRRVYLDLVGLPPQPEQVRAFLADTRDTRLKRDELIDGLVGSPEFIEHWTNKWADLLQVNRKFLGEEGAWSFRNWIRQAVSANLPYDQFVAGILTASGSTLANPPASYYKVLRTPGDLMENTTQLFLAVRFNCNKCHDHPFERWTQDQYYHLAAYFSDVGRKPTPEYANRLIGGTAVEQPLPLAEVIYDQPGGKVTHERTGKVVDALFPYTHSGVAAAEGSKRGQLSQWITSKDNPYFAKSYVNRLWGYLLGTGIIEPLDDIRAGNPPTNPDLLDRLTTDFIASNFDVQQLIRTICKSRTYQHALDTNEWNQDDEINYSHAIARRLPAETLYDAVHRVAGSEINLPGLPATYRASQLPDSEVSLDDGFLNLFGKPPRESACECERATGVMLGQALNLVNGPTIAKAIADPKNRISHLVQTEPDDARLVEELFVAILARTPSPEEIAAGVQAIQDAQADYALRVAELARYEAEQLPLKQAEWEKTAGGPVWTPATFVAVASAGNATLTVGADASVTASGENPDKDTWTLSAPATHKTLTGLKIEALTDASLPAMGPGRAGNGNFVLTELRLHLAAPGEAAPGTPLTLSGGVHSFAQESFSAAAVVDGNPGTGWAIAPQFGQAHIAVFELPSDIVVPEGSTLSVVLDHQFGQMHSLGKVRVSFTDAPRPLRLEGQPAPIAEALAVAAESRTPEQRAVVAAHYRGLDRELAILTAQAATDPAQPQMPRLMGAQDVAWALINSPAFLFNR